MKESSLVCLDSKMLVEILKRAILMAGFIYVSTLLRALLLLVLAVELLQS